jgi:hypothetical protein
MKNAHKAAALAATLCLAIALATGCTVAARKVGSVVGGKKGDIAVFKGDNVNLAKYTIARVNKLTSELGGNSEQYLRQIRNDGILQIRASGLFKSVLSDEPLVTDQPVLLIDGRIIDYEEGSRAERIATIGGQAFIIMRITLSDAATGETLAMFNSRGFIADALTGGNVGDTIDPINKGIVEFIKNHPPR